MLPCARRLSLSISKVVKIAPVLSYYANAVSNAIDYAIHRSSSQSML